MKHLIASGAAALLIALSVAPASAQVSTTQREMPNGNVRTTTRVATPDGTASTLTVDRADGSRTVVRHQTDVMGNERTDRRDVGSNHASNGNWHSRRVCRTAWHNGHRVRTCHTRRR